jgi:hypothetical protein
MAKRMASPGQGELDFVWATFGRIIRFGELRLAPRMELIVSFGRVLDPVHHRLQRAKGA